MNLDEVFDKMFPSLEQLRELQETLGQRIQTGLIEDMMNANSLDEIDRIIIDNDYYFKRWPRLIRHAALARNRIENLKENKFKSWHVTDMN